MRTNNSQAGFTLVELTVVIMLIAGIALLVVGVGVFAKGNMWYTESGAFRQLQAEEPSISELVKTERNVFSDSVFTVVQNDTTVDYCLDSDLLWNYSFSKCD